FKPLSLFMILPPPRSTLFPYTTLFRSIDMPLAKERRGGPVGLSGVMPIPNSEAVGSLRAGTACVWLSRCAVKRRSLMKLGEKTRSEEHTSELQSQSNLVCRLLLEKKKQ